MRGRTLMIGLLVVTAIFAVALWWFQTRAFYERSDGAESIEVAGLSIPVEGYSQIDATSSPLKLRACFRLVDLADISRAADAASPLTKEARAAGATLEPLVAPGWFDCFDAETLAHLAQTDGAQTIVATRNAPQGVDRVVLLLPDGRGWLWRQLNETYQE
jgi:hypothetical protein